MNEMCWFLKCETQKTYCPFVRVLFVSCLVRVLFAKESAEETTTRPVTLTCANQQNQQNNKPPSKKKQPKTPTKKKKTGKKETAQLLFIVGFYLRIGSRRIKPWLGSLTDDRARTHALVLWNSCTTTHLAIGVNIQG